MESFNQSSKERSGLYLKKIPLFDVMIMLYFVLSVFEGYLNSIFGSYTKYYILVICMFILGVNRFHIYLSGFHYAFLSWLAIKFISLMWTQDFSTPRLHMVSQLGMIAFFVLFTGLVISRESINRYIDIYFITSGLMGILTLAFGESYHGGVSARQVLVILGNEMDPNNLAALLIIAICIGLNNLLILREKKIISIVIVTINTLACLLSGSRAGLVTVASIFILAVFCNKKRSSFVSVIKKYLLIAILIVIFIKLISQYIPENIFNRLFMFDSYEGGSERIYLWTNTLNAYLENPLGIIFGIGWGSATVHTGSTNAVHNTFLTMLCDVGLIGTLLFLVPIVYASLRLIRQKEYLPVLFLISQFMPSFFIDAINKRFFWNAIIILFLFYANSTYWKDEEMYCREDG